MIPKIIHGNWFNPKLPSLFLAQCRESLMVLHPDWEFNIIYDEYMSRKSWFSTTTRADAVRKLVSRPSDNWWCASMQELFVDLFYKDRSLLVAGYYDRMLQAAERHKEYIWISDFVRLLQLYVYGGFWLDMDMYGIQPLDSFCEDDLVIGSINPHLPSEAILGAHPLDPRIRDLILYFVETQPPERGACRMNLGGYVVNHQLSTYPAEFFIPHDKEATVAQMYSITGNTHTVHCWKEKKYDLNRLEMIREQVRETKRNAVPL